MFYVCIMASLHRVLYIGVTRDLARRVAEHKSHVDPNSFTARCEVTRLVHFEEYDHATNAIVREKQLKSWRREKKLALIRASNPTGSDFAQCPTFAMCAAR